ncbi:MAG: hypothetical protein ACREWE_14720 [Gammaproteobacteria bacterium]
MKRIGSTAKHRCPLCRAPTFGACTEGRLLWDFCFDCLRAPVAEHEHTRVLVAIRGGVWAR